MTLYVPSITVDAVIEALAAFIQPFVGSAKIVRGQQNRVAQPPDPCVILTELLDSDLETPTETNDSVNQLLTLVTPARFDIQIDFYGTSAGDQCKAVKTVFRSSYAVSQFPDGIAPLYCSDGIQSPLTTAEMQWAQRWLLTASLQYNPQVVVPQQSATAATVTFKGSDSGIFGDADITGVDDASLNSVTSVDDSNVGQMAEEVTESL